MRPPAIDPVLIAQELLRCPSVTPNEGGALTYLARSLERAGFTVHRQTFSEPDTPDVENLYARIGTAAPHLVFAGHTDVVPPGDETKWKHAPFGAQIADGTLYGRGAVDMKGAIACFIAAAREHIGRNDGQPKGSISLLITGDEEGPSVNGTAKLLQWVAARAEKFDHCILGEPTNPERLGDAIKIGRRGSLSGTITVTGKQGHVAYPHLAKNPIHTLMRIMSDILSETTTSIRRTWSSRRSTSATARPTSFPARRRRASTCASTITIHWTRYAPGSNPVSPKPPVRTSIGRSTTPREIRNRSSRGRARSSTPSPARLPRSPAVARHYRRPAAPPTHASSRTTAR
jgi:acetylornithine deacetylase/succinyl-diaminopimelate desuccinylase-like protein